MTPATWHTDVKVFFIESKTEFTKNGKPKSIRVERRALYLLDPNALTDSGDYRIVLRQQSFTTVIDAETGKKKKVRLEKPIQRYTVCVIPRIAMPARDNPNGKYEVWYTKKPDIQYDDGSTERPFVRTNDAPMDENAIRHWLTVRIGKDQANAALFALQNDSPELAIAA